MAVSGLHFGESCKTVACTVGLVGILKVLKFKRILCHHPMSLELSKSGMGSDISLKEEEEEGQKDRGL